MRIISLIAIVGVNCSSSSQSRAIQNPHQRNELLPYRKLSSMDMESELSIGTLRVQVKAIDKTTKRSQSSEVNIIRRYGMLTICSALSQKA